MELFNIFQKKLQRIHILLFCELSFITSQFQWSMHRLPLLLKLSDEKLRKKIEYLISTTKNVVAAANCFCTLFDKVSKL